MRRGLARRERRCAWLRAGFFPRRGFWRAAAITAEAYPVLPGFSLAARGGLRAQDARVMACRDATDQSQSGG